MHGDFWPVLASTRCLCEPQSVGLLTAAVLPESRGRFSRMCSLMKRLAVDARKAPLIKQEMQSARFPFYDAKDRKFRGSGLL